LRQQRGGGNGEARILHVRSVGRAVASQGPQEGKGMLADNGVHLARFKVLEVLPAQIVVRTLQLVLACRKYLPLNGLLQPQRFSFFKRLQLVEPLEEEQVGNLLDDFQRIRNAAGPELVPDGIDLTASL